MSNGILEDLHKFGQSIWLDNINRHMLDTGKLEELIRKGLKGQTSNPSIFEKAVKGGTDYDEVMIRDCKSGKSTFDIYDDLTIRDVRDAADLFKPVYEKTNGSDGFVSLEINPKLAYDAETTVKEGKRLWEKVGRPNLMLKVPSTDEGFPAVEELVSFGFNINVTLIFSVEQYIKTAEAYIRGLKKRAEKGGNLAKVRSVASVFVSRIDTAVDKKLDELLAGETGAGALARLESLKGKAAVANSAVIYEKYREIFSSDEFAKLKSSGASVQRALWASTSTKNPAYSDVKYVEELIAKNTVNTLPEATLEAFMDHGKISEALTKDGREAHKTIKDLKELGIDVSAVCRKLLVDGVVAFEKSFDSLIASIEEKAKAVCEK